MYKDAMEQEEVVEEKVEISLPAEELRKLMDELKDHPEEAAKKINELINSQIQTVNI
jgi:hypothetical protein